MATIESSQAGASVLIVVPCYNEAVRLPIAAFRRFLAQPGDIGFVLVNDGSTDDTLSVLEDLARTFPERVTVLDQPENRGKGEAVRAGLLCALDLGTQLVGYWDADLATPLDAIPRFVDLLTRRPDVDLVLGARVGLLGHDIQRRPGRHYAGRVFATAASVVLSLPVYDTQCGAKLMRGSERMREILAEPFNSRWIFDVELIARFQRAGGRASEIYELPLDRWHDVGTSKVRATDYMRAVGEMIRIYRRYRLPQRHQGIFDLVTAPFVRYAGAGALGTGVHYALLLALVEGLSTDARIATIVGAGAGALVNYVLNYHITFASRRAHQQTVPRFAIVATLGVVINGLVMELLNARWGIHYLASQVVCTAVVLGVGFLLNRAWTFRE